MLLRCPNSECANSRNEDESEIFYHQNGHFKAKQRLVKRFVCKSCGKQFSEATFSETKYQKRPDINHKIFELLSSVVTIRRAAVLLKCNRKTVVRKMLYLSKKVSLLHERFLADFFTGTVQFDEMETFEESKAKPLSVALAVCGRSGKIIAIDACKMPARGRLALVGQKKYHWTEDHRPICASNVLEKVAMVTNENLNVICDKKRSYPNLIHNQMPHAQIVQVNGRGRRASPDIIAAVIEGEPESDPPREIETGGKIQFYDQLFLLNHVCAKIRADLSRMRRRTWATTKKLYYLRHHLILYIGWHNGYDLKSSVRAGYNI